jgi:hypothetical protein
MQCAVSAQWTAVEQKVLSVSSESRVTQCLDQLKSKNFKGFPASKHTMRSFNASVPRL